MDAYELFFREFGIKKDQLISWGIRNTIFIPDNKVNLYWNDLLNRISSNKKVYIRAYGRNGHATDIYIKFYQFLLKNINVREDPTNNSRPRAILEKALGLKHNKEIFNYQVSHIFGKTKNIFLFEAPWNFCFVPKIMDPFTGHESKGNITADYIKEFTQVSYTKFEHYIEQYNNIVLDLNIQQKIDDFCNLIHENIPEETLLQFKNDCSKEFETISV